VTFNTFVDAARDYLQRQQGTNQKPTQAFRQTGIVLVRNDSGGDLNRLAVLGIDSPVIDPADNEDEFKNRVALVGVTPAADTHEGKFVVLAEPVATGKIGRAYAAGVCPVQIDVPDEEHEYPFAEIADGVTDNLKASHYGSAAILWREGGTGVQWAVVRLGKLMPVHVFPVELTQVGGSQGDEDNPATWTYDVADAVTGDTLATAARVEQAVQLFRLYENKTDLVFSPVFTPLLGPIDKCCEDLVFDRLVDEVPKAEAEQKDFFEPYIDLPKGRTTYLRKNASLLQKLLVYRSVIMPIGVLRFCLEYAESPADRIGGIFECIRKSFPDLRGSGLLSVLTAVYDFRNNFVAHQDKELKDVGLARAALGQWVELLVKLEGLFVETG